MITQIWNSNKIIFNIFCNINDISSHLKLLTYKKKKYHNLIHTSTIPSSQVLTKLFRIEPYLLIVLVPAEFIHFNYQMGIWY